MCPNIDRIGSTYNNSKSQELIEGLCEEMMLCDIFRTKFPDERRYSWYRCKPKLIASRIDFALISQGLVDCCENTGYLTGIHSDHLAFYCYLLIKQSPRGRGYWKMNVKHLSNMKYLDIVNRELEKINNSKYASVFKKWEYMKYRIREISQKFSKEQASEIDLVISQLSEKVNEMEENLSDENKDLLLETKGELEVLTLEKTKSCIFRAKANFMEFGEKPTSYFFGLEKATL